MSIFQRLSVLACLLFGVGCKKFTPLGAPDRTLIERVVVTRNLDGSYHLAFARPGPYTVSVAARPSEIDWARVDYRTDTDELVITDRARDGRLFFGVRDERGGRQVVTERLLPLRGALNVRDLGGLPAGEGMRTRWGLLYRAGHLADLTAPDIAYLESLGLKTVVDFRSDFEIDKHPNTYLRRLPLDHRRVPIGDKAGNVQEALKRQIRNADPESFDSRAWVADLNRQFVDTLAHQYAPFLQLLKNADRLPLLYHCTAGKDRTGFATAIVLDALGVDRALILDDFLMSNFYRYAKNVRNLKRAALVGIDQRIAQPLVEVDRSYLESAFAEIDRKYGDTPTFLAEVLDFGPADLTALKARLLVPLE